MTPKEKAEELVERMTVHHWTDVCDSEGAKQCALIAVDEILTTLYDLKFGNAVVEELDYWEDVKQEIENKH
jgi:hypothetical protein